MTRLVGADGVHEFPLAIVTLGDGEPAIRPGGEAARGESTGSRRSSSRSSPRPSSRRRRRAGRACAVGRPACGRAAGLVGLDDVILRRSSARSMDPSRRPSRASSTSGRSRLRCAAAECRTSSPSTPSTASSRASTAGPTRHAAARRQPARGALPRLPRPGARAGCRLRRHRRRRRCDPRRSRLPRGPARRRAGRRAGCISPPIALGIGASGMTFLGLRDRRPARRSRWQALLFTCVGVPTYRTRPGGPPGAPKRSLL